MSEKQFSKNWELIQATDSNLSLQERVYSSIGIMREIKDKWPYDEGFPKTPYDINNAQFSLVLPKTGFVGIEEVVAIVDYGTQYRSEGLQWRIIQGTKDHRGTIERGSVIAWYQI